MRVLRSVIFPSCQIKAREEANPDVKEVPTLGSDALGRILVVVYTWRGGRVRLISARPATPTERRQYSEGL